MAHDAGLHVTVHAAESGPASNVRQAVEELHATRIGHGYRVIEDPSVYQLAKDKGVHFEVRVISLVRVIYNCIPRSCRLVSPPVYTLILLTTTSTPLKRMQSFNNYQLINTH